MILHQLWVNLKNNSYPIYIGEDLLHDKAIKEDINKKTLILYPGIRNDFFKGRTIDNSYFEFLVNSSFNNQDQ